jgi:tryptophan synthase alpha subunit
MMWLGHGHIPTTDEERVRMLKKIRRWIIYCTSRVGITGRADSLSKKLRAYVRGVKKTSIFRWPWALAFDSPERAATKLKWRLR